VPGGVLCNRIRVLKMPLPMVHLAISVHMHAQTDDGLAPAFLLGSIAPDAIHMRPNTGRDDKNRTHLIGASEADTHRRIRELLVRHWERGSSPAGFVEGYAAHLLADRLWAQTLLQSFRARIPPDTPYEALRSLYYRETDWIDLDLYHRLPWREDVWRKLAAAEPVDFEPLLTAGEIGQWRARTLGWYDDPAHAVPEEPAYMTSGDVEAFAAEAAQTIAGYFRQWRADLASRGC
jgi:hypothetical protein